MSDASNWGATDDERRSAFACDALGFAHDAIFHRAIDVAAPRELVYRWLCQLRVAPYSYDLLDNFARRSPPQLVPGLERLAPDRRFMTLFRLASFVPNEHVTIALDSRIGRAAMGDFAGTYRLRSYAGGATRLAVRVLVRYPRGPYGLLLRRVMPACDLFMFRKQLRTLARYAERDARALHPAIRFVR